MTRRPSPRGRRERSLRTRKDDEAVEGTSVFRKASSFAGGHWERRPWPAREPNHAVSQKEPRGAAQRRTLQVFRGNGLVTGGVRQGCEEGSSRNARVLRSALSTRVSFRVPLESGDPGGQPRWRQRGFAPLQNSSGSLRMARLERVGHHANAGEVGPREGLCVRCGRGLRRSRSCPYVESVCRSR